MSSKTTPVDNLTFLYLCLEKFRGQKIDFSAVAKATGTNVSATRMRYSRLKNCIEATIAPKKLVVTDVPRAMTRERPTKKRKAAGRDHEADFSALEDDEEDSAQSKREAIGRTTTEPPAKSRTRGVKIDFKSAFECDTASYLGEDDGNSDEYEEARGESDDSGEVSEEVSSEEEEEDMIIRRTEKRSRKLMMTLANSNSFKTVASLPITPRSIPEEKSKKPKLSVSATLGSLERTFEPGANPRPTKRQRSVQTPVRSSSPAIQELSPEEIREDLSQYKTGMMVPLGNSTLYSGPAIENPFPEEQIPDDASTTSSERASRVETEPSYNCTRATHAFYVDFDADDKHI